MDFCAFRQLEFARRDARLKSRKPMKLKKAEGEKKQLRIVYVMTWVGVCGGSKIILQHCNKLAERGHSVAIACHFPRPNWFPLCEKVDFLHVPMGEVLGEHIPKCDVIVVTYWKEIYECVEQNIAPVVYFEQGDSHLFEPEIYDAGLMEHIRAQIEMASFVYTVSTFAAKKLKENFGKEADVIPNAVDRSVFYPAPETKNKTQKKFGDKIIIAAIGSERVPFKCMENIVKSSELLKLMGYNVELHWVTPDAPSKLTVDSVLINPSQNEIGDFLRRSDIFVCASLYESFCLPVLEAMTCGTAVVTTDSGGVGDFVRDGVNALVIEKNNIPDMANKIVFLIRDSNLRESVSSAGLITAQKFDWEHTTDMLVDYYKNVASYAPT